MTDRRRTCRFCSSPDGELRPVRHDPHTGVLGARARRMAQIPVYEHAACLEAAEAAHNAAEARRRELHDQARTALHAGDQALAVELIDQAADVTDSDYLERKPQ